MPLAPNQTLITGYYTRLINSSAARTNNIRLSCAKINGKILNPGELFSFNQTVGPRTSAAGYQSAAIFSGNQVIQGIGGGICQTVSTIYNVVLEAGLSVVERHRHSLKVAYVAPGRDATVAWGSLDFKFKNSNNYPICLNTEVIGGKIIMRIFGRKTTTNIVKLHPDIIETVTPGEDEVEIDDSLADGEKIIVRKPKNGVRVILYRDTYSEDNVLLDREKISEDYYKPVRGLFKVNSNYIE
jgi:vancomycin resistance protein YoaR